MAAFCHECGKNFVENQKLYLHMAIHDKTEYTCNICEKTVIGRKKLQNHMQTHETFDCRKCNSKVKMNSRASHYKKCDGEAVKTFACNKCSYVVDRQDRLAKHIWKTSTEKRKRVSFHAHFVVRVLEENSMDPT